MRAGWNTRDSAIILGSIVLFACNHSTDEAPGKSQASDLLGLWYAEPRHNHQVGHLALEIEPGSGDSPTARLSLLDIDAHDLPIGSVERQGNRIDAGILPLELDPNGPTLTGSLPADLVPVHSIDVSFRRVPELPQDTGQKASPVSAGKVEWRVDTGSPIWSGVTLADSRVFFGNDAGEVRALEAESGRELWRFSADGAVRARPTLATSRLLVQSDDGRLYCLDGHNGRLDWQSVVQPEPVARPDLTEPGYRYDHYASAAAVAAGKVFVGSADGGVYAFDLVSGERLWRFDTEDVITSTPTVDGGTVFVGSFDGRLYAMDAADGSLRWSFDSGAEIPSSPAVFENLVIVGSRSYDLMALEAEDGAPIWRHYLWFSWVESSATIRDGIAYIGSSDAQRLYAFEAATGELRWEFDGGGSLWARPAVSESTVFIGAVGVADYIVDHRAAFWAVDRRTGLPRWKLQLPRPDGASIWGFASSPAADGDTAFVGDLDGVLYALSSP